MAGVNNAPFLALTFDPVRVQDSGEYTCSLMIESDLLDGGRITVTAVLDLQVQSKQPPGVWRVYMYVHVCTCLYMYVHVCTCAFVKKGHYY